MAKLVKDDFLIFKSPEKFKGGLTLRRGESSITPGPSKLLTVSVVGLSGGEKDKGSMGTGKSCLCNRFVASVADDYHIDHISVLSQSDFSGRVVNNDHFLYWGEVSKTNEDGVDFNIQVVEQTEFIDDASFQPFKASGKQEPYSRRCANTRLVSAEKLMYICKNQLGLEKEFTEQLLPDGRSNIDGFICVFDVSLVPNRTLEKQVETTAQLLNNLIKTKKPVVLVTTKNEEGNEIFVREAERLVNRKEFRGVVPLVEVSAHENINVDQAFFLVGSMIDRTRGRVRILSYLEASRARREIMESAQEQFARIVRVEVTDYGASWTVVAKKLASCVEFQNFVDIFGVDAAQRIFRRHVKKLKDNYLSEKVARYLDLLPEVLHELFPTISSLGEEDWVLIQERIKEHQDFGRWFVQYPEDTTWMEANLFDGDASEHRIPFDVLDSTEAETVYKNLLNQLHAQQKRTELRADFKNLLEETGYVTPGKKLDEVRVLFMGRECFEALPEEELLQIYDIHQQDLIERSKRNFQELLLEKADIFYQFRSSPAGTVTHDDILDITETLAEDGRYKALDRMDADRKLLLFQHLGFVHCPIREHCPSFPQCTDSLVERLVSRRAVRPASWSSESNKLNIILLGLEDLTEELSAQISDQCPDNIFQHGGQMFELEVRRISGDVSSPQNAFRTNKFNPQGCFCIYTDITSLEYIRSSLEKALLANLEHEDRLPFQGLPMVILFEACSSLSSQQLNILQNEGQNLADSLHCPFLEYVDQDTEIVSDSLRSLVESVRERSSHLSISAPSDSLPPPDIRVIMCLLCGDPFSLDKVLGPLLGSKQCTQTGVRSVLVEQQVGLVTKKVEFILSSYHSATDFRDELVHGFILVFSNKRRASLATLSAFSMNIPELPIQVVNVAEDAHNAELNRELGQQGYIIAMQLNGHYLRASINKPPTAPYSTFLQEVLEKKGEIEKAFAMDERLSGRLDDSGEGTLERPPRRNPVPPPRIDSYINKGHSSLNSRSGSGRSGSGSEIYERLPDSGSHGDLVSNSEDDSDIYSQLDSLDRRQGGQLSSLDGRQGGHRTRRTSRPNGGPTSNGPHKTRRKHGSAPPQCSPPPIPPTGGGLPRPKLTSSSPPSYSPSPQLGGRPRPKTTSSFVPSPRGGGGASMTLEIVKGSERNNFFQGWADDSQLPNKRTAAAEHSGGAYTTGRRGGRGRVPPPPSAPPGKLNIKEYTNVSAALSRLQVKPRGGAPLAAVEDLDREGGYAVPKDNVTPGSKSEYAQPMLEPQQRPKPRSKNRERRERQAKLEVSDSETDDTSDERPAKKPTAGKRLRKKRSGNAALPVAGPVVPVQRAAIPVATPQVPMGGIKPVLAVGAKPVPVPRVPDQTKPEELDLKLSPEKGLLYSDSDSSESLPPRQLRHSATTSSPPHRLRPGQFKFPPPPSGPPPPPGPNPQFFAGRLEDDGLKEEDAASPRTEEQTDKQRKKSEKEEKNRIKELAKQEKIKKEKEKKEEREKAKEEKKKEKAEKKGIKGIKANSVQGNVCMEDFRASEENPVPVFLSRTIEFIEQEGLDAEGLYRVPGNRAHVDLLFAKFDEDKTIDLWSLDIAVNAVATAVKDFFFKRLPALLPPEHMTDLETIAAMQDRAMKLLELKKLLERLPRANYAVLKYIFKHFVRVTERSKDNCMDSKNLAICWWPTILQYEFGDLEKFETMRPHLEDVVQTLIDQFRFVFCGQEEVMMV